jgi:hypothetical protein
MAPDARLSRWGPLLRRRAAKAAGEGCQAAFDRAFDAPGGFLIALIRRLARLMAVATESGIATVTSSSVFTRELLHWEPTGAGLLADIDARRYAQN